MWVRDANLQLLEITNLKIKNHQNFFPTWNHQKLVFYFFKYYLEYIFPQHTVYRILLIKFWIYIKNFSLIVEITDERIRYSCQLQIGNSDNTVPSGTATHYHSTKSQFGKKIVAHIAEYYSYN